VKKLFLVFLLFGLTANAQMMSVKLGKLLSAATTTGLSQIAGPATAGRKTFQATVSGTGTVGATVLVNVSDDGVNFVTLGTITLSGTTSATDGFASEASWGYYQANVSAISGTGAAVTVISGQE
jgi:hypothetical protein